jgi:hypothetical protein
LLGRENHRGDRGLYRRQMVIKRKRAIEETEGSIED